MHPHKTNAARILDKIPVPYDLITYAVDEDHLNAIHVAEQLSQPIEQVFKTILVRGDKSGVFVCVIPGALEVNLKNAASVSGNKKVETVAVKELFSLTGYIRGGCSPIGMKKKYPVYLDKHALDFTSIYISAGQRGLQLKLNPTDLVQVVDATICTLTDTNP
ncbi:Cys-tRNA(Pro) deacylase YbaK [Arcticibacter svalbardensis MN12-7]|uniref:Cys-tRNA(Pro)/Cys-tRNA(Cys) deacylase n=1 Tax=Arcticibacter svalbardensis MN12-7 TaxID=1150600 RepID=R9GRW9_9SPHI|nr:Cys-tRNA(Pro) deacylase [Arcticibacter svalbardensis]EOR94290.1 Cys-tRNA(Pro) deacylase YbaK [Arcticibacter svalbardensis MN12-7]